MPKRMLIDAAHPEETRVVVLNGNRLEEFDFESSTKKQVKGNIYLAKVTRVEPSLQAAFVDYGGNRHGFLAFSEIHPDYYRIPISDRSGVDAEMHAAYERGAANGAPNDADDAGVPLAVALPEPVPVEEAGAAGDEEVELDPNPDDTQGGDTIAAAENMPPGSEDELPDAREMLDEAAEPPEEAEPTLAAWQEEQGIPPDSASENGNADFPEGPGPAPADAIADLTSEPGAIALRAAEDSIVAAEIGDLPVGNGMVGNGHAVATQSVETLGGDEVEEVEEADAERRRRSSMRHYKIQEVVKRRQIMLVQVAKEERGNKGAALTTYLSLAGRYCVLMPNTGRGGGVSRKITSLSDRRRLKEILEDLDIPEGMGVIVRTAGAERSKAEIKRDYEYLLRLWNEIRDLTLKSTAPALIYEEGNLIKRSIRDLYTRDLDEVLVEGEEGYRIAKAFMRTLMPSHAKRVQPYRDPQIGLLHRFQVESQIDAIHSPVAQLRSGGYIVINQTEALVAIDVNSGRSTRERNIEETALRTNLEAAEEIARQLRLRDLAGLIVIDFIDMEEHRNQSAVERRLKDALKNDRARIQVGRISPFGLLEMSRQRLRPSLAEASTQPCPHCGGTGFIRSVESTALYVLRSIEEEGIRRRSAEVCIYVPTTVALYILNQKRESLAQIEARYGVKVMVARDDSLIPPSFRLERLRAYGAGEAPPLPRSIQAPSIEEAEEEEEHEEDEETVAALPSRVEAAAAGEQETEEERGRRRRRRRRRRPEDAREGRTAPVPVAAEAGESAEAGEAPAREAREGGDEDRDADGDRRRRRRGRRGGRPRVRRDQVGEAPAEAPAQPPDWQVAAETIEIVPPAADTPSAEETDAAAAFKTWPGDAGLETASLAPLAGDVGASAPARPHVDPRDEEETPPAPTAEAEPGIPFESEAERVLEDATAASDSTGGQAPAEAPAANHNEDVLTVTEKPANPRRGWWQRLIQP
jgi:ribonuclease E